MNDNIKWEQACSNTQGITTIAYEDVDPKLGVYRTMGYNGILLGDKVLFGKDTYTVVMVSRLGDFGLSTTGELPYVMRVSPLEVTLIVGGNKDV